MWRGFLIASVIAVIIPGSEALLRYEYAERTQSVGASLPAVQKLAFFACRDQFAGRKLVTTNEHATVTRKWVPYDVCLCQSRFMVETLKPDAYVAHRKVVDARYTAARTHSLPVSALVDPEGDGQRGFEYLSATLSECVDGFQKLQEAKTEQVKQIIAHRLPEPVN